MSHYPHSECSAGGEPYAVDEFTVGKCTRVPRHFNRTDGTPTPGEWTQSVLVHAIECSSIGVSVNATLFQNLGCAGVGTHLAALGAGMPGCHQTLSLSSYSLACAAASPPPPPALPGSILTVRHYVNDVSCGGTSYVDDEFLPGRCVRIPRCHAEPLVSPHAR